MDLALNNLQRLICNKNQPTNQPTLNLLFASLNIWCNFFWKRTTTLLAWIPKKIK